MSSPIVQRLARRAPPVERCDLCDEPLADAHRHLLEANNRSVACVCPACAGSSLGKYRLIPDRYLNLADFAMTEAEWTSLRVPVGICFISAGRAFYPGPMGPTESTLDPITWSALGRRYPILNEIQPEVEALLVNRARGAHDHFVVPIDTCFSLAGLIRLRWHGLSGGSTVWNEINTFFDGLRKRSRTFSTGSHTVCQSSTT